MSDTITPNGDAHRMEQPKEESEKPRRKRSLTSVTLEWLAEKIRIKERIRSQVESGTYNVNSSDIAKAIINDEH